MSFNAIMMIVLLAIAAVAIGGWILQRRNPAAADKVVAELDAAAKRAGEEAEAGAAKIERAVKDKLAK